ncbi:MAG: histidine phosphatase family protein [Cyclobacteriaceae bacterium]|nr:histidine phosphatase family protein [Cyclobacteriaceae bacterium]MCH8515748.1 histidine phosphatase family protein [Cyclobacteriaceae bacterium]
MSENIKEIYVVRHGETDLNKEGIVQGSGVDASINKTGKVQARKFYEAFKNEGFEKIYTSALKRTKESVADFQSLDIPQEALAEFNEICWGVKEGKAFLSGDNNQQYLDIVENWKQGATHIAIPEGESPDEVSSRIREGMQKVVAGPESKVLICMHGRAIRILMATVLNYSLSRMDEFTHTNLCLYKLVYTNGLYRVDLFDYREHLNI